MEKNDLSSVTLIKDPSIEPYFIGRDANSYTIYETVYPGTNVFVRFTCKEKVPSDTRDENDILKGIVKWLVEILDETDEPLVGLATILTMVKH